MPVRRSKAGRTRPGTVLALLLIGAGVVGLVRQRASQRADRCPRDDARCAPVGAPTAGGATAPPALERSADEACRNVGYLCAELADADRMVVRRWRAREGSLVVRVPPPDGLDAAQARALQRAAVAGIRLWNGRPFPVVTDERGTRDPDIVVRWSTSVGGTQLGVARTEWSPATGLRVTGIDLATRNPRTARPIDPAQVRLTAAHEMGHALGLPHSDQPRDVMYPTNTATSLSARDYRTLEALYALEDGTAIVR